MGKLAVLIAAMALLSCTTSNKTIMQASDAHTAENEDGFVALFDGKSTAGWHTYGKTTAGKIWKAEDGVLHLDPAVKKETPSEGGDLVTNGEYENFHLKLEWKISPRGNSGIIFFINEDEKYRNTYETGMEMQVLDNGNATTLGHSDAKLYTHRAGDLYDLMAAKEAVKPAGEWNAAEIVANKGKLDFYLNGQHTLSTTMWDENWKNMIAISKFKSMPGFGKHRKGKISLQEHSDEVWYRNIRIKNL
ncbi:MAG TPA: DUF1080 domain-containing protein [Flavisolibacter sp.]|jgi:hypothetical protein|nr:DUF1080 domain-containing protein [Flavisolibacter sp.]